MTWAVKRKTPYTAIGIKRLQCVRCAKPAAYQWNACSDGNYRPICAVCDVELNALVLRWFGHPDAVALSEAYAHRVRSAA